MADNGEALPGRPAPDFELTDQAGQRVRLSSLRGRSVVLFFYPRDESPVCTAEVCHFRDAYAEFGQASAIVLGVSSDSRERHQAFAQAHRLPFQLLADIDGAVRKAYGVKNDLWLLPGRVTFVIGPDGIIRHRFASQLQALAHVRTALNELARCSRSENS